MADKGFVMFVENKISRVEVITENGRTYVGHGKFEFSVQDDERTLKIFKLKESDKSISN